MTEIIRIENDQALNSGDWRPVVGDEFTRYMTAISDEGFRLRLQSESIEILSRCVDPRREDRNAGLVLGYVQSGKTASFTGVTALAHDNGFNCIVVVAGVSKMLLNQTMSRLKKDLSADDPNAFQRWAICENPSLDNAGGAALKNKLYLRISEPDNPHSGVPLIVVMKERSHLNNLNLLFASLEVATDVGLRGIRALIIDDEAHMHTPNVAKKNNSKVIENEIETRSRIYSQMKNLRDHFVHHTLLQYTATPQANLLAETVDDFSPSFVKLLTPGHNYLGGKQLFLDHEAVALRSIPDEEVAQIMEAFKAQKTNKKLTGVDQFEPDLAPPKSLQDALASYLIVCGDDKVQAQKQRRPISRFSMLIHTDAQTLMHSHAKRWTDSLQESWKATLATSDGYSPDREDLIDRVFKPQYDDIARTVDSISDFDDVLGAIPSVLGELRHHQADGPGSTKKNGFGGAKVEWSLSPYWILNGGEMLGVGFTVEGLVTTHMLRSGGQGQADTIQQRGRFFGYRLSNVGRTRVWMQDDVRQTFKSYVEHEETLRRSLVPYEAVGADLRKWRRIFKLSPEMKLTRKTALRMDVRRPKASEYIEPKSAVVDGALIEANRQLIEALIHGRQPFDTPLGELMLHSKSGSTESTRHEFARISKYNARVLLALFHGDPILRATFDVLCEVLDQEVNEHSIDLVFMAHNANSMRRRDVSDGVIRIPQGRSESDSYDGDKLVCNSEAITIQVHLVNHGPSDSEISNRNVPYLAVCLPSEVQKELKGYVIELSQ